MPAAPPSFMPRLWDLGARDARTASAAQGGGKRRASGHNAQVHHDSCAVSGLFFCPVARQIGVNGRRASLTNPRRDAHRCREPGWRATFVKQSGPRPRRRLSSTGVISSFDVDTRIPPTGRRSRTSRYWITCTRALRGVHRPVSAGHAMKRMEAWNFTPPSCSDASTTSPCARRSPNRSPVSSASTPADPPWPHQAADPSGSTRVRVEGLSPVAARGAVLTRAAV